MNILSLGASAGVSLKGLGGSSSSAASVHYELRAGMFLGRELEVVSFEGHEALNAPYVYDVVFASSVPVGELQAGIFGFPACLSVQVAGKDPRVIQGLAVSFEAIGAADAELSTKSRHYSTRIVPRLWLLQHNRKYRVFQDKTAIEIALAILGEAGISPLVRLQRDKYPLMPFVYQRGETDLELLEHVLAVAGVFYYFHHASGFLDELVPGAGAAAGLVGGLGGIASGAADLGAGASAGSFGAGAAGSVTGGLSGGAASAIGNVAGEVNDVAGVLGLVTTLVLCSESKHTHAVEDASASELAGAAASAGLAQLGAMSGALGSVASVAGGVVDALTEGQADAIPYDANGQAAAASERIFSFRLRNEVRPKAITVQDWNLTTSRSVSLEQKSNAVSLDLSLGLNASMSFAGHGSLGASLQANLDIDAIPIASKDVAVKEYQRNAALFRARESDAFAESALAQLRSDRIAARGEGDCRRLAAGYRFQLSRHPISTVNAEYVVTRVDSVGYAPHFLPQRSEHLFRSTFECVPSSLDPKPKKPPPRPPLGLEAAIVVGPVWGDVNCDSLGRIQVRFRWAEATGYDPTTASRTYQPDGEGMCWVRWLERWAGDGFGTLTLPRVGTEVLVDFLQSEGERPIAVGQLYSSVRRSPFDLPQEATKVGIRSAAAPFGAGASEMVFEDAHDDLSMSLRTSGRFNLQVDESSTSVVGGKSSTTIRGGSSTLITDSAQEQIEGGSRRTVEGGSYDAVVGDRTSETAGALKTLVTGSHHEEIGGETFLAVGGDQVTAVSGDRQDAVGGSWMVSVGASGSEASVVTNVSGNVTTSATGELLLHADKKLTLECGGTQLTLTPEALNVLANVLALAANKNVSVTAGQSTLRLADQADLIAPKVNVLAQGASIHLATDAAVMGSSVKLGSGAGGTASTSTNTTTSAAKPVALKLLDHEGKPLAARPYTIIAEGVRVRGVTDANGGVAAQVPHATASAHLQLTMDDGHIVTYTLAFKPMADASTREGLATRLQNLGYLAASDPDEAALREATRRFQWDHADGALSLGGKADDATLAALVKKHGH